MALKQLLIRRKIDIARQQLDELESRDAEFLTRSDDLAASLEEAATDEDIAVVNDEVEKLESEQGIHDAEKERLSGEIEKLEKELADMETKSDPGKKTKEERSETQMADTLIAGGLTRADMRYIYRSERRAAVETDLRRDEVREFYEAIRDIGLKKRGLSGVELTVPETVLNRVQIIMGDYGNLYNLVDVVRLKGTAKVVLDGANPEAIWVEMCDPVQELASAFKAVELDGYKVGGFIPVCNALMEDSMINLAMYVDRKLAIAIVKAVDKALAIGTGDIGKQPMGIIPNLAASNIVTLNASATGGVFGSLISNMGLIDTGENEIGVITAAMKRTTYYKYVAPLLVLQTAAGTYNVPNITSPNLAGLPVEFSQNIPEGKALIGDYEKYLLLERAGVRISSSEHVRFVEDQTVFKGIARYDGKPIDLDDSGKTHDWILVTFPEPVNP